jgi:hypothetical protein
MDGNFFKPHIGSKYEQTHTLIVSESAYDWVGDDGAIYSPQESHPKDSIDWNIKNFGRNQYFRSINRVLCGVEHPPSAKMYELWDRYAYTIYVQQSVGQGAGKRPKSDQWAHAGKQFLKLLEELRPRKVIVTGVDMWNRMPDTAVRILDDLQAYRLKDGSLAWCLAVPHPANRRSGFRWKEVSESVRLFGNSELPRQWPF